MEKLTFNVNDLINKKRLSEYLKFNLGFSSSLIKRVKFGGVYLNGKAAIMSDEVSQNDEITVCFQPEHSENIEPINIPLSILYEDDFLLAIDKSTDMPTHPSKGNNLATLGNAVAYYYGKNFVFRAINRLDRGTSGIVIIAKNPYSAAKLGRAMKERKFKKQYTAIVRGVPLKKEGRIDAPIARECEGEIKRVVRPDGKPAITDYKIREVLPDGNSLCSIILHTGRTHQIRVHFAHIGHPLVGDFLYGDRDDKSFYLRCTEITFPHPFTNDEITIKA